MRKASMITMLIGVVVLSLSNSNVLCNASDAYNAPYDASLRPDIAPEAHAGYPHLPRGTPQLESVKKLLVPPTDGTDNKSPIQGHHQRAILDVDTMHIENSPPDDETSNGVDHETNREESDDATVKDGSCSMNDKLGNEKSDADTTKIHVVNDERTRSSQLDDEYESLWANPIAPICEVLIVVGIIALMVSLGYFFTMGMLRVMQVIDDYWFNWEYLD